MQSHILLGWVFLLFHGNLVYSKCNYCKPDTRSYTDPAIVEVEKYIAATRPTLNLRYRPHYHVAPPVGWMNEPNGFVYYKGNFHIFFQYYPFSSTSGRKSWGHSISPNLVNWKSLSTALLADKNQIFSGGAIVDRNKLILMYTGRADKDVCPYFNETQNLAFSGDGFNFHKYNCNPVIPTSPNCSSDFRDPKVWKHKNYYYVIIGSSCGIKGRFVLYRSLDMIHWKLLRIIGHNEIPEDLGYMWECPDLFLMNGKYILLFSPQGVESQGDRFNNLYQTGYIIGSFNYKTFEFIPESDFQELDYGHDFYASQTIEQNGTRYIVAWFNMWGINYPEAEDGWVGTLTQFRELSLHGNRLLMNPVKEMLTLRESLVINGTFKPNEVVKFEKTAEIIIAVKLDEEIEILLEGSNGGDKVIVSWDPEVSKVVVNRNDDIRQVEWSPIGSRVWRLFLDASSLELFCGEGEVVFSSRAYPDGDWNVSNTSPQALNVEAYKLKRSVPP